MATAWCRRRHRDHAIVVRQRGAATEVEQRSLASYDQIFGVDLEEVA
ncbi:hypothetical protein ACFQO7_37085 [Catellatospora aurea]|uniref:Uncharacterized protein n=1 Tax=Catellatospora aurea TaxID=1337874 RepID=A0ABW2HAV0_9ACTN